MLKLIGKTVYLSVLEREDCRKLWSDFEYNFAQRTEPLRVGHSVEGAESWFDEIQKNQNDTFLRLGIFLTDGTVIGDIALQDIDWRNRSCTLGYGIQKLEYHNRGFMTDAATVMLEHAFTQLMLERISATTLAHNHGSRRVLEKCGFTHEGTARAAECFDGKRHDRLIFGLLRDEYNTKEKSHA